MKIILCISLLCITAVSVFGEPQELNGIVGESVNFTAAVKIDGSLRYNTLTIGDVTADRFTAPRNEKYKDRLQWDSSTGLFSLSALRLEDSGVYTVQDTHQNINTVFQLNVYKDNVPVSKPHLSVTHDEYPCTLLCTVERGTEVTLSWHREGEEKPYVTSPVESAPGLHLPQTVERSGTYTCEAKNSVSNETSDPLTVEAHCTVAAGPSTGTIVASVIAVLIVALIAVVLAVLYRRIRCKNAGAISELVGIRSQNADTKSKLDVTRSELEDTKSKLDVTRSELEVTKSELKVTRSELEVTKSELKDTKSKLDGIKKEHAVTKSELEVTKSELEVTKSELEVTKSKLEDQGNINGKPPSSEYEDKQALSHVGTKRKMPVKGILEKKDPRAFRT